MIEDRGEKKERGRGRSEVGGRWGRKRKREEARWPLFASALIKATWSSPQTRLHHRRDSIHASSDSRIGQIAPFHPLSTYYVLHCLCSSLFYSVRSMYTPA